MRETAAHRAGAKPQRYDRREVLVQQRPIAGMLAAIVRKRLDDLRADGRKYVEVMNCLLERNKETGVARIRLRSATRKTRGKRACGDSH